VAGREHEAALTDVLYRLGFAEAGNVAQAQAPCFASFHHAGVGSR
jgi:hypothetical protein